MTIVTYASIQFATATVQFDTLQSSLAHASIYSLTHVTVQFDTCLGPISCLKSKSRVGPEILPYATPECFFIVIGLDNAVLLLASAPFGRLL